MGLHGYNLDVPALSLVWIHYSYLTHWCGIACAYNLFCHGLYTVVDCSVDIPEVVVQLVFHMKIFLQEREESESSYCQLFGSVPGLYSYDAVLTQ